MRHLLVYLRYRGTSYHGYQVQKNAVTVAQTVQDAVERVFGERLPIKGCSRTDTGVHANRFALTFFTDAEYPPETVVRALNASLPPDIAVLSCEAVAEDFHPRYSCRGKRYVYRIYNATIRDPFREGLALHVKYPLNVQMMDAAAREFIGTHDFSAFCGANGNVADTVREITAASVIREGDMVSFSVTGSGFLYNMVRIMTGTLIEAERGKYPPTDIAEIIASNDRGRAGFTAPPHGLYLDEIFY